MFDFKRASKADLKREFEEISSRSGDDGFGTKRKLKYLPQMLIDDEQVLAFSSGFLDGNIWLIVLTDQRVIFFDKDMLYGLKDISNTS